MSLPTLVIGSKSLSSWSLRAWLALKHLNIEFDELELPLDTPDFAARIERYSPTRRVPALMHGLLKIWDSLAICEYANELAGGRGWPSDANERALARALSAEMHSGFQGLRSNWPMNAAKVGLEVPLTSEGAGDVVRIDTIWRECLERFSHRGPWLFGTYSIVDAMYAPVVLRFRSYGAQLSTQAQRYMSAALADPHLQAWIKAAEAA